jgi:hypothetical protein
VKRHAKASIAGSTKGHGSRPGVIGLACLCVLGLAAFLGSSAPSASAADECPNVVFRTGASAKLPDCRAFELVSPSFTGGLPPTAANFFNIKDGFEAPLITSSADSVIFNTTGGALSGSPGSGFNDRYRAKRTADGWATEFIGASGAQTPAPWYGGVSADHEYYFTNAGGNDFELDPGASLQDPFGGKIAEYLHRPDGGFELIAKGSLGEDRLATGHLITPGAGHVIFSAETQLEPQAPPTGSEAVYDRSPSGPTHVVSLLPGDTTPGSASYLGASKDGTEIAFSTVDFSGGGAYYVRLDNTTTEEVARPIGVVVGKELTCTGGPGAATLAYQWLRNGAPIGGATSAGYTTTAADEGTSIQCQVSATTASEGASLKTSTAPKIVAPLPATIPPSVSTFGGPSISGTANVGQLLTCSNGTWSGSPTFAYQWFRNGVAIGGATVSTYTTVGADKGTAIQCRVTGTNAGGSAVAFSSLTLIQALPPTASVNPAISNVTDPGNQPAVGDELSCSDGTWTNSPTFAYQWLRDGIAIGGATSSTYIVVVADEGKPLQCRVTATNADATAQAVSARVVADPQPGTTPPDLTTVGAVFGAAEVGGTLECEPGTWAGSPTFAYQWLRNGAEIGGATESTYTLVAADRQTTVQCRVTATNAGGSAVAINADAGARYVDPNPPAASATLPAGDLTFGGVFGGHVFYADGGMVSYYQTPADLYSFDTANQTTTRITIVGDARFVNVSDDGSRVYFESESQIGGEGTAGQPNLYVWSRADDSTTYIATVAPSDVESSMYPNLVGVSANLALWAQAIGPQKEWSTGRADALSRATLDGSVLVFESTAQLTPFDNDGYIQVYRYDAITDELACISCAGAGPATGEATLQSIFGNLFDPRPLTAVHPAASLTEDGNMLFFEAEDGLLPQDGNGHRDVYRWKKGEGLALITTGQQLTNSYLYAVTPDGSDVVVQTAQKLLPQDENGGTVALYDARVNGGFPPPESAVTEPCSGDVCQGAPSSSPGTPGNATAQLNGTGNVPKPRKCRKGKRRVVRNGKELCVKRHHKRANGGRRAAR